ncbi:TPA: MBL fold metallo-hydrolase [Burkholderia cenocepacia]|uniref:MBL fold metallo-hydrolase n=1 Tax=Burkholderia cenocepacia TaxID=95486 RepID=UPI001F099F1B|nr:MBL fold metallo-hydrolase [Burkholderia cenocepacia]MCW5148376.1 MBL fold metallo-hydrolase [Burkholderia cenocepacia]MDN7541561.1 MBL fold metallo-hydrolase [Burkholderia cenocepacia]MDS0808116.1 MBL fold metallo-hydrolase [Burkholderia cenocepacia]
MKRFDDEVYLFWEPHVIPLFRCNIWYIRGRDRDVIIDSGMGFGSLKEAGRYLFDKRIAAVATHAHLDHVGNLHEFDECMAHHLEAPGIRNPDWSYTLADDRFDPLHYVSKFKDFPFEGPIIDALPCADYDASKWRIRPAKITRELSDGDVIDTGDRAFEVLHLPGHSPGSIGLWEEETRILFSGDAVYDAPLIDELHHSSIPDYIQTMERLARLPANVVHAGHDASFGRARLIELVEEYLGRIGA